MKFYQEITLIPDDDITPYFLWSRVYTQLHIALADVKNQHNIQTIGVSFPQYCYEKIGKKTIATLGTKLRVFAHQSDDLNKLNLIKWLEKLSDYVHLKPIKDVPENHGFVVVKRHHHDLPKENLARRYAKRHNMDYEAALQRLGDYQPKKCDYPFIALKSETNQNPYQLLIYQSVTEQELSGNFNTYGMNNVANNITVPHWQ